MKKARFTDSQIMAILRKSWKTKIAVSKRCMPKNDSKPKSFRKPWQKSGEAIA